MSLILSSGVGKLQPMGQIPPTACFVSKFYWNTGMSIHLCIFIVSFLAAMAESKSLKYILSGPFRKSLPTQALVESSVLVVRPCWGFGYFDNSI